MKARGRVLVMLCCSGSAIFLNLHKWQILRSKESASNFALSLKKTSVETHRMLVEAFGDNAMSQSKTFLWYKRTSSSQQCEFHVHLFFLTSKALSTRNLSPLVKLSMGSFIVKF
jgi:hypothetical protein